MRGKHLQWVTREMVGGKLPTAVRREFCKLRFVWACDARDDSSSLAQPVRGCVSRFILFLAWHGGKRRLFTFFVRAVPVVVYAILSGRN